MLNNRFLKNLLREENRPLATTILVLVILLAALFAYLLLDFRTNKQTKIGREEQANTSPEKLSEKSISSEPKNPPSGPQVQISTSDPEVAAIIERVFKHIFLPSGNVQVETVVKPDELRKVNPVFYQFAKVGDQVLVYFDRAILYDPVADRVLDVIHVIAK